MTRKAALLTLLLCLAVAAPAAAHGGRAASAPVRAAFDHDKLARVDIVLWIGR